MPRHPFEPVFDSQSRILILGSFPSVQSRNTGFYYGHRQTRFWRILAALFSEDVPSTVNEKRELLLSRRIALWDVLKECDITGSSDASIRAAVPNDIAGIVKASKIRHVFTNGKKAHSLYECFALESVGIKDTCLPSSSPANAAFGFSDLLNAWRIIADCIPTPEDKI